MKFRRFAESLSITIAALVASLALFGVFMVVFRNFPGAASPGSREQSSTPNFLRDLYYWMYFGAFGSSFSWQNTLSRAAPLILTGLCTALSRPAGVDHHRRGGGVGARRLGGRRHRLVDAIVFAADEPTGDGNGRHGRWRPRDRVRRRAVSLARRQRHYLKLVAHVYRHRRVQLPGGRADARSGKPQQAVNLSHT